MRPIAVLLVSVLAVPVVSVAQEHRPEYSAKDIGAGVIAQREAQTEKPGPPLSLFAAPLAALERDLMRAVKQHNLKLIDDSLAPGFLEIQRDGSVLTKAETLQRLKDVEVVDLSLSDFRSVDVRDDVGVLTYTETVRGTYQGRPIPFRSVMSSVWHKQKGRWQMVFHTSTPIPPSPVSAAELEGLERDVVARQADQDATWMSQIFADDVVFIGPNGKRYSKADIMKDVGQATYYRPQKISDISAHPLGPDSGVVTSRLDHEASGGEAYTATTVWKRGPAGWQVILHQYSAIGKP